MNEYTIKSGENTFELNVKDLTKLDAIEQESGHFHALQNHQAYQIEVIPSGTSPKEMIVIVNGNKYPIEIADQYDQLINEMGLSAGKSQKLQSIKAPMPGLILEILVAAGETIEKGTPIVILEAMKMENTLKSEGGGVVKSIGVKAGNAVDKGQILIEME